MSTYPKRSPLEAIRVFCIECQGGSFQGVSECVDTALLGPCPVFPFRLGVNPNYSAEERERRKLAASKRAVKGVYGFPKTTHQTPFDAPESPEVARAEL